MPTKTFEVVTTFSQRGFQEYGSRMVNSFRMFWPADVPLKIYSENLGGGAALAMPAWQAEFKARNSSPRANGRERVGGAYNFRFDAVRFSHKVAAYVDAYRETTADVLVWLDADTLTHGPVTTEFLCGLFPEPAQVAWLARDRLYPECGFVMFRTRDPAVAGALRELVDMYESGRIFAQEEWHDSFLLQQVVENAGLAVHSLSGAASATMHPFVNSPLGARMDHLKGPRKGEGRSRAADIKADRPEPYWRRR